MTFNLYVELGTRLQDARALELLSFPMDSAFAPGVRWSARWWNRGQTRRMRAKNRSTILARLAAEGFNELELRARVDGPRPRAEGRIVKAWITFYPSVTNDLFAAVPSTPSLRREDERIRRHWHRISTPAAGSLRDEYAKVYRLDYPTEAEFWMSIELPPDAAGDAQIQAMLLDLLQHSFPPEVRPLSIFGYGSPNGQGRRMTMLTSLGGVGAWTDQLGAKFENIYPILIGPTASCEGLASALPDRCSCTRVEGDPTTAIVSIAPHLVDEVRQNPAVKEWVILRDLSQMDAPDSTLDEIFRKLTAQPWLAPFVVRHSDRGAKS